MAERVHRKYGNKKTQFAGLTFDSKAEGWHACGNVGMEASE